MASLIGICGLIGWYFRLPVLNSIVPGYKPIAISAAIVFILLGGVQFFAAHTPLRREVAIALLIIALLVTLFGLLEIVQLVTGVDVTIEDAILTYYPALYANHDAHISPFAGVFVFLIGLAQSCYLYQWVIGRPVHALVNGIGLLGSLVVIGSSVFLLSYLYRTPFLYNTIYIPIAAPAVLAVLLLGMGLVATAGAMALPLSWFSGVSTRARLLRAFLPLTALMLLLSNIVQYFLTEYFHVNPAFSVAILTILVELIIGAVILHTARTIGNFIDRIEQERVALIDALTEQRQLFQTVVENAPVGIVILMGAEHRYTITNTAYAPFVAGKGEIIGRTVAEVFPEIAESIVPLLDRVYRTGEPYHAADMPLTLQRDGKYEDAYITFSYTPWCNKQGEIQGVMVLAFETTDRVQAEQELRRFNELLEQRVQERTAALAASNKELEAFSYSVAHDLRSPLRSVDGFSRYLLEHDADRLDARGLNYLQRMRASAQRMGRLIDDLLNLARLSRVEVRRERVNLSALATAEIEALRQRDPEHRVNVEITPDMIVNCDQELLRVALGNLLENAWKFTSTREVAQITVSVLYRADEQIYWVRDNGVGFDMAYVEKLFQPFQRLHTEEEFPGTGIGLALVQRIIQRHGGRIWAEGIVGQGATFYFTLGGEQA